ncbi:MAG: acyl--CoA ligase, partial [Synergistales bacterium]|nr:acyl--CoA ligase [Synergistales bacterium]
MRATGIPGPYSEAFDNPEAPFLYLYSPSGDGSTAELFTRRRFLSLGRKAATVLHRYGLQPGDRFVNGFGANSPVDLAFRLGAILTGTVPVTVNWQADSPERAAYKVEISKARLLVQEHTFPSGLLRGIEELFPALPVYPVENLDRETPYNGSWPEEPAPEQEKLVIFTSGTTGAPKGVSLTYGNYASNAATFRSFLAPLGLRPLQLVMPNPLHHANSSALSDWCMREPGAVIHMLPGYGTAYWRVPAETASSGGELLAPAVARHIDFLHNLAEEGALP